MREAGTTQSELWRKSGVRQPNVSQMVSGHITGREDMLRRLLWCMGRKLEVHYRSAEAAMPRSVKRSLLLHRQLARRLDRDTLAEWTPLITRNIERMQGQLRGEPHLRNLERWRQLISDRDLPGVHRVLTGRDDDSSQMREVSPMGGLLSQDERDEVLRAVR